MNVKHLLASCFLITSLVPVQAQQWVEAAYLKSGIVLTDADGAPVIITNVELVSTLETVYNLEVEEWHSYYANSVLVHNGSYDDDVLDSPVGDEFEVTSLYGAERSCKGCSKVHPGTDYGTPTGTPVNATASGDVVRSDYSKTFGNVIIIDHGPSSKNPLDRVFTLYAHGKERLVKLGGKVEVGQLIMKSGNTGKGTGAHLHYEVVVTPSLDKNFYGNLSIRRPPAALREYLIGKPN